MNTILLRALKGEYTHSFIGKLDELGCKIVFTYHIPYTYMSYKKYLPDNCVLADYYDMVRGVLDENLQERKIYPSSEILDQMQKCLGTLFPMMERINYYRKRNSRIYEAYFQYIIYWLTIIQEHKVEAVFFSAIPHEGITFVLYNLAKILNIKVIIFERTIFHDRSLMLKGIYDYPEFPEDFNEAKEFDNRFIDGYYDYQLKTRLLEEKRKSKSLSRFFKSIIHRHKDYVFDSPYGLSDKKPSAITDNFNRFVESYRSEYYKKQYNRHLYKGPLSKKSVFYPLHFEPEKSTIPAGGRFWNQITVLNMLLDSLPEGWVIYVKEHPRQFSRSILKNALGRDRQFYEKLAIDDRIMTLDIHRDSADIIQQVGCVVTVTGTIGWEAILKSVPVMIFGYPWYYGCTQMKFINDYPEIREYLESLDKGEIKIDLEAVKKYSTWLQEVATYKGSNYRHFYTEMTDEENEIATAESIIQAYQDLY